MSSFLFGYFIDHVVVDIDGIWNHAMFLLKLCIKIVENCNMFDWTSFKKPFKYGSCSFNSYGIITISTDKLMNVRDPNLIKTGPFKRIDSKLKNSEYLLKISILPKKISKVQQHNGRKSLMFFTSFIRSFYRLKVTNGYLNIDIKLP